MFTGIVQELGVISNIENKNSKKYFIINCLSMQNELKIGDSIACNGICLTVISFNPQSIKVEAMNETLHKTTANLWSLRKIIHLERAMRLSDRLDGHLVQGHIDTITPLISKKLLNNTLYLEFFNESYNDIYIVKQGSIAIDGVSLTVSDKSDKSFEVSLISHTLKSTHFAQLQSGDYVNLEFDIIGKYLNNFVQKKTINLEWLKKNGF